MLGQRLRRWPSIEKTMGECVLCGEYSQKVVRITCGAPVITPTITAILSVVHDRLWRRKKRRSHFLHVRNKWVFV